MYVQESNTYQWILTLNCEKRRELVVQEIAVSTNCPRRRCTVLIVEFMLVCKSRCVMQIDLEDELKHES